MVSFLPDNERVVYWNEDRQQFVAWRFRTGEIEPVGGLDSPPGTALSSPDGETLYVVEQNVDGEVWMLTLRR